MFRDWFLVPCVPIPEESGSSGRLESGVSSRKHPGSVAIASGSELQLHHVLLCLLWECGKYGGASCSPHVSEEAERQVKEPTRMAWKAHSYSPRWLVSVCPSILCLIWE